MTIEIKDTAIQNIVNGLKIFKENQKYWSNLAEEAKRDDETAWMANGFETKSEMNRYAAFASYQLLAEISTEFYEMVKNEVEAN